MLNSFFDQLAGRSKAAHVSFDQPQHQPTMGRVPATLTMTTCSRYTSDLEDEPLDGSRTTRTLDEHWLAMSRARACSPRRRKLNEASRLSAVRPQPERDLRTLEAPALLKFIQDQSR